MAEIQCINREKTLTVPRSPMKRYKITTVGCLCDSCYPQYFRTAVYEYGCSSEHYGGYENTEAAIQEIKKANRLWNSLVEIDRFEREEYRRLTSDPVILQQIETNQAVVESLVRAIAQQCQKERKQKVAIDPSVKAQLASAKGALKALYAQNKASVARMKVQNAEKIAQLKVDASAKIENATDEKEQWPLCEHAVSITWQIQDRIGSC